MVCKCLKKKMKKRGALKEKPHFDPTRTDLPFKQHLTRLNEIGKKIDNNPPRLVVDNWLKSENAKKDVLRINQIGRVNKLLLSRINTIMRSTGCTDNFNPHSGVRHSKLRKYIDEVDKIEKANKELYDRICDAKPDMSTNNVYLEQCWKHALVSIRDTARYALILPGIKPADNSELYCECLDKYRQKAYFVFAHPTGRVLGKITILLYTDILPITTRNFIELILNYNRQPVDPTFPHYIGSSVYRIFKGLFIEMGDITKNNGNGGVSSFGVDFPQENFSVAAKFPGMLAMIPDPDGMVNSKFLITVKPLKVLNGKRVIFGRVIKGLKCIELIEKSALPTGKPEEPIFITKCGLIPLKGK